MNPNPYQSEYAYPGRPSTDRAETLCGLCLFFGCVHMIVGAMTWGATNTWNVAPLVAVILGFIGIALQCAAIAQARHAGYLRRKQYEWDRRYDSIRTRQ